MREKHHFQSQTRSYTDTTYGYSLTGGTVIILPGTYTNSFEDKSNETFRFISLNIPLTINYFYKKWQFEAGIIPSILISTKEKKDNSKKDPEMAFISPEVQFSNTQKSTFDLCISPTYKLCKNICLGIEYKYGLSNILISEKYSDLKLRCLGIKILYKL